MLNEFKLVQLVERLRTAQGKPNLGGTMTRLLFVLGLLMLPIHTVLATERDSSDESTKITFRDRSLDLNEILDGFPYDSNRMVGSLKAKKVYFMKLVGDKQLVYKASLGSSQDQPLTFGSGEAASSFDLSKSLTFGWAIHTRKRKSIFLNR